MCCRDASTGRIFAAAILAASFLLAGCTTCRVAFTREIREQYLPESGDLKKLQYYLSDDITLQREFVRGDAEVSKGHKLVTKETGLVEEVIVRARTPGVATEVPYDGRTFYAVGRSRAAYIEVLVDSLDAVKKSRKVLPGMTLPPE
jgi:hypothetical protein